jgi:hypothetical protein
MTGNICAANNATTINTNTTNVKIGKLVPLQTWIGHEGSREAPRFQDNRHLKVVRLSAVRTGHFNPQEIFLVLISVAGTR